MEAHPNRELRGSTSTKERRADVRQEPLQRVNNISLAAFERRALPWMAARLPAWVKPDHLTTLALFAAVVVGVSYGLTRLSLDWLWLANLGLLVHWWGDSLDGTLARYRRITRERYGFFFDHHTDAISVLCMFAGLAVSPLVRPWVALLVVAAFFALSILMYLVSITRGVFRLSYFGLGPTEGRLTVIAVNVLIWITGNPQWALEGTTFTIGDALGLFGAAFMLGVFLLYGEAERRHLGRLEPPPQPPVRDRPKRSDVPAAEEVDVME